MCRFETAFERARWKRNVLNYHDLHSLNRTNLSPIFLFFSIRPGKLVGPHPSSRWDKKIAFSEIKESCEQKSCEYLRWQVSGIFFSIKLYMERFTKCILLFGHHRDRSCNASYTRPSRTFTGPTEWLPADSVGNLNIGGPKPGCLEKSWW